MSRQIEGCVPSALKFKHVRQGDIAELLTVLKTQPAAARTVTTLDLDVYAGVPVRSMTDVLRCLPNLEHLRLTCQRNDLAEALFSRLAPMPNLRTFVLILNGFAHTYSLFEWLTLMPGLRVLRLFGEFETNAQLRESFIEQAHATGTLRHLRVYEHKSDVHSQQLPTFVGPMPAMRSARITLRRADADLLAELGESQPIHLSLGIEGHFLSGEYYLPAKTLVSKSVLAGMQTLWRLRRLDIEYLSTEDRVFDAVRALGPQLLTLSLKCWSSKDDLLIKLDHELSQCVGEPLPALRELRISVYNLTSKGITLLRSRVQTMCRRRRVRFALYTWG